MKYSQFISALATMVASEIWSYDALERSLQNRFPRRFRRQASALAADLIITFPKSYAPSRTSIERVLSLHPKIKASWVYARKNNTWPDTSIKPAKFAPSAPFDDMGLPRLANSDDLADWLGIMPDDLLRFADKRGLSNQTDNAFAPHYRFHNHSKKFGGLRLIEEPKPFLKTLQRRILSGLLDLIPPSPAAYGFIKSRDCLSAAALHGGEAMLICFDLRAFFASIRHCRIFGLFRTLGYPESVAHDLTGLCTLATPAHILTRHSYDDAPMLARRHLPQGAPTSPALANLCTFNLDRRLLGLARRVEANYSRYADDMSFSGDPHITKVLARAVPAIIRDEGFILNPRKTRVMPAHHRQITTGLVINEKINITRQSYDRLKTVVHHLRLPDDPRRHNLRFLTALSGQITWVERVNPARGARLRDRLAQALAT